MDPVLNQTKTSRSFWKSSRRSELFNHTQTVSRICRKKKTQNEAAKEKLSCEQFALFVRVLHFNETKADRAIE